MEEIFIKGQYILQNDIENCIKRFEIIKYKNIDFPQLSIIANDFIIDVDILLFGYLILFKKEIPNLKITLEFKKNTGKDEDDVVYKIIQYMEHSYLTTGINDLLLFRYSNYNITITSFYFKAKQKEEERFRFKWSEKYIPVSFIDKLSYKVLFLDNATFVPIGRGVIYDRNNDNLYQACRKLLNNEIGNSYEKNINLLSQLSFYKALSEAKILNFFLYSELNNGVVLSNELNEKLNIQASRLVKEAFSYYESVKNVFYELQSKPPLFQFLYATLLSSDLLSNSLETTTIERFQNSIHNLFEFTNELFLGLKELADNIVKHSSSGYGVITARVFKPEMLALLKSNNAKELSSTLEQFIKFTHDRNKDFKSDFLDINVIDNGIIGVIDSLIKKISESDNDYEIINSGTISFRHFLDPNHGIILTQQAKRATAHLGLLIFSKLVESNKGMFRAGTWAFKSNSAKRDNVLIKPKELINEVTSHETSLCSLGTNYNILLPFDPLKSLNPYLPKVELDIPTEITAIQIQSIETLLSYKVIELPNEQFRIKENTGDYILIISPKDRPINSRDDELELWNEILFQLKPKFIGFLKKKRNTDGAIVCLNLNEINKGIDICHLFRLLGNWEINFPGCPLVIFNISTKKLYDLIKLNEDFYNKSNKALPYWNNNSILIVYSYQETKNGIFYFTDALWGESPETFYKVNQLLSKTNYNANSIINKTNEINELSPEDLKNLSQFCVFQNSTTLLPFDLVLKSEKKLTFFEHNALVLLRNDLKISI